MHKYELFRQKTTSLFFISDGEDETHNFAVQMQPQYHQAIVDMILHYDWRSVIYIYQSSEGLYRLQKIYENIPRVGTYNFTNRIYYIKLSNCETKSKFGTNANFVKLF